MGASASIDVSTLSAEELSMYEKVKSAACIIDKVHAREVYDSRGNPTVEVDLTTKDGVTHSAIVPSGASTGIYEACELRDGDKNRCMGKGVTKAVANVINVIAPLVIGKNCVNQAEIDDIMIKADGTPNKTNLGANAILGVSLACAKAGAAAQGIPLYQHFAALAGDTSGQFTMPTPCFNVINGGSHAGNKLAFQEYFVIPTGATSFKNAMEMGSEVYHNLKSVIKAKFGGDATLIGDEGGFAPPCDVRTGVELVMEAIEKAGYAGKCTVGLDVAASEFKVEGEDAYDLDFKTKGDAKDPKAKISSKELAELYAQLMKDFPVATIEDPFDQDDWQGWVEFTKSVKDLNTGAQVVGDDLTVTNVTRIKRAIDEKACDCLLLKVNQIGSVTESIAAVTMAKAAGWGIMTSHRSGETEDTCIADLAVGLRAGQIKSGAPCRSDRMAKYNQLLRIEEQLGAAASYPQGVPLFKSLDFAPPSANGAAAAAAASSSSSSSPKKAAYTLVLVRHGHSEWNDSGQFTGWYDCDLAPQGVKEAEGAAVLLKEGGFAFDQAYTSVLTRAKRTCKMCLEGTDQGGVPVTEAWELNERHYGGLTGLNKQETVEKHGKEQVLIWRRSYDVPPPPLVEGTEYYDYFFNDPKYAAIKDKLPLSESLENTVERVMPYFESAIAPTIKAGKKVLIAAHGNSLRALLMSLDNIGKDVIAELNLPTGVPLVYDLDEDLKPIPHPDAIAPLTGRYLGDQAAIREKILGVVNQTK